MTWNGGPKVFGVAAAVALASAAAWHGSAIRPVDGDTVDYAFRRWRLAGFDAPEIRKAKCAAERAAGVRAKARLAELVAGGSATLEQAPGRDPWGRTIGRLTINGVDVAATLISERYAVAYDGTGKRHDWCAGAV